MESKTFIIDHPTKPGCYLVHTCLEGPEAGVYYRGQETVVSEKVIELPEYVSKFAKDLTVHLTPVGCFAELFCSEVLDSKFTVYSNKKCKFNWIVHGSRGNVITEPRKDDVEVHGEGP